MLCAGLSASSDSSLDGSTGWLVDERRFSLDMLFRPGTRSQPLNLQVRYSHNGLFAWVWQNLVPLEHARLVFEAVRFQAKSLVNLGQTHNRERRSPAVYRHRRRKAACPAMVWRGERVVGRKSQRREIGIMFDDLLTSLLEMCCGGGE
ncbi:hypothetical protein QC764_0031370 [Podospora pseudoanserina]|uniref:Uncharacterized protein n=1 Tax=Podospora pseudoanserina TaxID=2609844 RepID=A0ABR0IFP7_9PEZI|nr:hypothetical protein QC764_0031370 [Podospora pseudoanserina]